MTRRAGHACQAERVVTVTRLLSQAQARSATVNHLLPTTMSTQLLLRAVGKARFSPPVTTTTRAYATATARPTKTTYTPRTTTRTSTARASTAAEKSNAATPSDVDVPPEAYSAQPESVPSSSTLQDVSVPPTTNASFVPAEFTESVTISGSPADPNAPDWSKSYFGLSTQPFPREVAETLLAPVDPLDVEMKPGTS